MLLLWTAGGLLTVDGRDLARWARCAPCGGQYQYLKEAYGPLWGFLFGWASFLVIMSGGIASLSVAFGEYLGSFVPFFSTANVLLTAGGWRMSGGQVAAALAIAGLTAVNYVGLKEGAGLQNVMRCQGGSTAGHRRPGVADAGAGHTPGCRRCAVGDRSSLARQDRVFWRYDGCTTPPSSRRDPSHPWTEPLGADRGHYRGDRLYC